jgi:hypothetical protein
MRFVLLLLLIAVASAAAISNAKKHHTHKTTEGVRKTSTGRSLIEGKSKAFVAAHSKGKAKAKDWQIGTKGPCVGISKAMCKSVNPLWNKSCMNSFCNPLCMRLQVTVSILLTCIHYILQLYHSC